MDIVASTVTAPATVEGQSAAKPSGASQGKLDHLMVAPASAEPLFISIWAGTANPHGMTATLNLTTREGGGPIPVKDTANVVPIGYGPFPNGCTIRVSTAADGTGALAAAKVLSLRWY